MIHGLHRPFLCDPSPLIMVNGGSTRAHHMHGLGATTITLCVPAHFV